MSPLAVLADLGWDDAAEWLPPPIRCGIMRRVGGALQSCGMTAEFYTLGRCDDGHTGRFPVCAMHHQQMQQRPERFGCPVGRCDATMRVLRWLPL